MYFIKSNCHLCDVKCVRKEYSGQYGEQGEGILMEMRYPDHTSRHVCKECLDKVTAKLEAQYKDWVKE